MAAYYSCTKRPTTALRLALEEKCEGRGLPRSITNLIRFLRLRRGVCHRCGNDSGNCVFNLLYRYESRDMADEMHLCGLPEREEVSTGLCVDCTFKCCLRVFCTRGFRLCTNEHPVTRDDRYCPECKTAVERATLAKCSTYGHRR